MNPSAPPPFPPCPPARGGRAARGGISPRKLILAVILAGSILFFFLILFAGLVATLHEGSPREGPRISTLAAIKRVIVHEMHHFSHHK